MYSRGIDVAQMSWIINSVFAVVFPVNQMIRERLEPFVIGICLKPGYVHFIRHFVFMSYRRLAGQMSRI